MTAKLTLNLDAKVIESAKRISKARGQSISRIVEEYFIKIAQQKKAKKTKGSILELRGIGGKAGKNFDYKKELADYLTEKYK